MNRALSIVLVVACLTLLAFDLLLLRTTSRLGEENRVLRNKVTPSLAEQYELFEYRSQGDDLRDLMTDLRRELPGVEAGLGAVNPKLLFYFPSEDCRRSLHLELTTLERYRQRFAEAGVRWGMVFTGFAEPDFAALVQQFGIQDHAFLDREDRIGRRFRLRGDPLVILLGSRDHVLLARVSRAADVEGSERFYQRVGVLLGHDESGEV